MNAIDANILAYAVDDNEPAKQSMAQALVDSLAASGDTILVWQAIAELIACLRRWELRKIVQGGKIRTIVERLCNTFPLVAPSKTVLDRAFDLKDRDSLSHWDSLLLAACLEAGVDTLYSEDMQHGQNLRRSDGRQSVLALATRSQSRLQHQFAGEGAGFVQRVGFL